MSAGSVPLPWAMRLRRERVHLVAHLLHGAGELSHAGDHLHQRLHGAELFHLLHGLEEVVQGELPLQHFLLLALHFLGVKGAGGGLHERREVAVPEDPLGHPLGMEAFEAVELFADADVLDRHAGHRLDGQRRPAAGVAVQLGEDHAVDLEGLVERFGGVDGVLPGHGVADEQHLMRHEAVVDQFQLAHQGVVDVQPAGRVEDQDVPPLLIGLPAAVLADLQRRALGRILRIDRHVDLLPDDLELFDSGRPLQVGGDEHRFGPFIAKHAGQFAARCRFAGPLQTAHHQHGDFAPAERDGMVDRTHELHELLVDDAHDLLLRPQRLEHAVADGLFRDAVDEVLGDVVVDVGLEERLPHLPHPLADVRLGEPPAPQTAQRVAQRLGDAFKHGEISRGIADGSAGQELRP
jgi:hypothetical protein